MLLSVHVSHSQWHTCLAPIGPRFELLLVHVLSPKCCMHRAPVMPRARLYLSRFHAPIGTCVTLVVLYVSPPCAPTRLLSVHPHVASSLSHVSHSYMSMWHLCIHPCGVSLLIHVSRPYWSTHRIPTSPRVASILVHVSPWCCSSCHLPIRLGVKDKV